MLKRKDASVNFNLFLSKTQKREGKFYHFCTLKAGKLIEQITELFEERTFLNEYIIFYAGYIHIRFSFHSKFSEKVSDFIKQNSIEGLEVTYLGEFVNVINGLSDKTLNLKNVVVRTEVPEELLKDDPSTFRKWVRFVMKTTDETIDSLYIFNTEQFFEIPSIFIPIDPEIGIYEAKTTNLIVEKFDKDIKENGFRSIMELNEFDSKYLWLEYVVLERTLSSILKMLGDILSENSGWNGLIYSIDNFSGKE
jgi:hypothetical protein